MIYIYIYIERELYVFIVDSLILAIMMNVSAGLRQGALAGPPRRGEEGGEG